MSDVTSLLPPNATEAMRAQEAVHARMVDMPAELVRTLQNPDAIPDDLLPWLAWAFGVDGWDETWTADQKRAAVKAAWSVRTHKGTIGAVRHAMAALGIDIDIVEWFEESPPGVPYTYRLRVTSVQTGADQTDIAKALAVVDAAKNLRSHMTSIDVSANSTGPTYHAGVCLVGSEIELSFGKPLMLDGKWKLDGTHKLKGIY